MVRKAESINATSLQVSSTQCLCSSRVVCNPLFHRYFHKLAPTDAKANWLCSLTERWTRMCKAANGEGDGLPQVLLMHFLMALPLSKQVLQCYGTFTKYMRHSCNFQLPHIFSHIQTAPFKVIDKQQRAKQAFPRSQTCYFCLLQSTVSTLIFCLLLLELFVI